MTAQPGEGCANGESCLGGANCQANLCACPNGMAVKDGVCSFLAGNLGPCSDSTQCTGGAYCDLSRNLCLCPGESVHFKIC